MKTKEAKEYDNVQTAHILKSEGFNVFCSESNTNSVRTYSRKDFYKICLFEGEAVIEYADRGIQTKGTTLFFGTPYVPYSWENIVKVKSYACLFTEEFLKTNNSNSVSLQQSPLFKIGGTPIFNVSKEQCRFIESTFKRMLDEYNTDYVFKSDLIRNYINILIHEALKMQPSENFVTHKNASARVSSLFLELLERQFPIEIPNNPLQLKTANDYAQSLAVHVNHLNRAVKDVTGKSTTTHISERIITEAKAMLRHTDWNIAEIAYGLGFEYPTYFNNYFKRLTGATPTAFRE